MLGKKFNKLIVIAESDSDSRGEAMWKCLCDCGRETITSGSYLRTGHTKSCGCRMDYGHDFKNRKFGKLSVIRKLRIGEKLSNPSTAAQWLCRCECGSEKPFLSSTLFRGSIKNCDECPPNEYIFKSNIVIGFLKDGNCFKVNTEDFGKIKKFTWRNNGHGYIVTNIKRKQTFLHDLILPCKNGCFRDHINRDKTDNRSENLRYATAAENQRNIGLQKNNTSGYIGVSWHKSYNKFRALLECEGKSINLGRYETAEEAAKVRDKAALLYFKEFAVLNFPKKVGVAYG